MVRCTVCGGEIKRGKSIIEELKSGRLVLFCCQGCLKLFNLKAHGYNDSSIAGAIWQ